MKLQELTDFKDTHYYNFYKERIENYQNDVIVAILKNNDNEVKYSWNDVLKQVFIFINQNLKGFEDSIDVNPTRNQVDQDDAMQKFAEESAKQFLGIKSDIS